MRSKYGNVKTVVDGVTFASKAEARRYAELKLLERAGQITHLELQKPFRLRVADIDCGKYVSDFIYFENGKRVVEDVKGVKTAVYKLKKKLMAALYNVDIREVS